jgi:DNA-binding CsgD family transcriptional regulator
MAEDLLERDQFLRALDEALLRTAAGHGQLVLVRGEAGIGKTALVERFIERCPPGTCVLWGACEALFTPRPLGPLYDIAEQARSALRELLAGEANRAALFAAVLDLLTHSPAPTIVVLEDIHWADEATLDLIKFLARRIHRTTALLIGTYRDEELGLGQGRDHPLRLVLGDLPTRGVTRLHVPPLSEAAVATLAQQSNRSAGELYRATGGNPYFLQEVLHSETPGVPLSVSDAVLAQVARRSPKAQRLLEMVAVVPHRIEWWLAEAVGSAEQGGDRGAEQATALEECLAAGILHLEDDAVGYRHELARQAVERALAPTRRRALHAAVLHALIARGAEQAPLARLVHHAVQADERELALRFAPAAAKQASAQGAHREAAAYYATALRYADFADTEQRAELLDGLSHEFYLTGQIEDAVAPCEAALAIWRALNRSDKVGHNLRRLSRLSWFLGKNAEAARHGMEAVERLETLPPGHELAMAYANLSHLRMLESDAAQTLLWGNRAIALAERLRDIETLSYALNNIGSAELGVGDESGREKLERSLALALEHGYEEHAGRAYANLAEELIMRRDYIQAEGFLRDGIAYCAERDLGAWRHCLRGQQARARLGQGDWIGAEEDAGAILSIPWASGTNRGPALLVLSYVRLRRGDPGAEALLDEERALALATGELERIAPMAAARAEWRWLQGDLKQCAAEARVGFQLAQRHSYPWYLGELAIWMWRAGVLCDIPARTPAPFALQMAGDWRGAAARWERMGCPYEQALALADGDEPAQRAALSILAQLGATPAAEVVRRRLRAAGARGLPRGPRPATRDNPHGLTPRQLEILLLLAEGLHNAQIADRLSTTPKTVDHHVSAVLAKLEVRSRTEAVRVAYEVGLVPHTPREGPAAHANVGG